MKPAIATFITAGILASTLGWTPVLAGELNVNYLYKLSDFNGMLPYSWATVSIDKQHKETYVLSGETVKVFNNSGMEIYRFDYDYTAGTAMDLAVDDEGRILLLVNKNGMNQVAVYNFRGEQDSFIQLSGIPAEFADFAPNHISIHNGNLYLANMNGMKIVVTDNKGTFLKAYDLAQQMKLDKKDMEDSEIGAFAVDKDNNLIFTLPIKGKVVRLLADGTMTAFGKRGSGPGRFGVPSGIATDSQGNYYISDRLRCVVLVFDQKLGFVKEFGFRGTRPENLIVPNEIAMDDSNRLYVTQQKKRGVNVYQISSN